MQYNVFIVNADGSSSLIGSFADKPSAEALANSQASGTTCRIELSDITEASLVELITVP